MARSVKFTKKFGAYKKGDVWSDCSNQLAQKLVNKHGVAEFTEELPGDKARARIGAADKVYAQAEKDAQEKAKSITDEAEAKAEDIIKAAEKAAEDIKTAAEKEAKDTINKANEALKEAEKKAGK